MNTPDSQQSTHRWGRVAEDGSVYVRVEDGERKVGQWPGGDPEETLAFFQKRFDDLVFEVRLLEQRLTAGTVGPDEATAAVGQLRGTINQAQAVGDFAGLHRRLDGIGELVEHQRQKRRAEGIRRTEEARVRKERIVEQAERIADSDDWRNGADRLRELLDGWKELARLDRSTDDALWRRFSTARTTYTRRRKSHFSELSVQRNASRLAKQRLVEQAEELAASTEWAPTGARYRDLMRQWKAAGAASKAVDDQLWQRFRAAQDRFFGARDAASSSLEREFAANAATKEALLAEAEALVPVRDPRAAKRAFQDIAQRWDAAGRVPRERIKDLEGRFRKVEQAIRGAEDHQWRRSNPETRARAADTVAQLEASIEQLRRQRDRAVASGDSRTADEAAAAVEARREWLAEARKALEEFSG